MSLPLDVALSQCVRHASIMNDALSQIPCPLTGDQLHQASPELIRLLDQFVLRFIKLQDTLGTHVLRQFAVQVLAEPVEDSAFIDVLNLLERRGYLMVDQWHCSAARAISSRMNTLTTHCARRWLCRPRRSPPASWWSGCATFKNERKPDL
ncbi:MAG: hypothetical protein I8H87_01715 [Comamonadaceae bacterium]|nr:hypothetical protein [Comamonadaceae bacterium]